MEGEHWYGRQQLFDRSVWEGLSCEICGQPAMHFHMQEAKLVAGSDYEFTMKPGTVRCELHKCVQP